MAKTHMGRGVEGGPDTGLCGWGTDASITSEPSAVTCSLCRKEMRVRDAAAERSGQERPFTPHREERPATRWDPSLAKIAEGDQKWDSALRKYVDKDPQEIEPRWRWTSLDRYALHCTRVLDDRAPIRSSFRDEAPVQSSTIPGAPSGREDVIAFQRAMEASFVAPYAVALGIVVPAHRCRAVLEARLCGVPVEVEVAPGRKGTVVRRENVSAEELAEQLSVELSVAITENHVGLIYRAGRRAMVVELARVGMLPPPRVRVSATREGAGEEMRAPKGYDLDGWKAIADYLGVHETTARTRLTEGKDPIPVHDYRNGVIAKKSEIDEWQLRQVKPRSAGAA